VAYETDDLPTGLPVEGVDRSEWHLLILRGQTSGQVLAEDVAHVLRNVELTADTLQIVYASLAQQGIDVDETLVEVDDDDTPRHGTQREIVLDDEDIERLLSRRRRRRGQKRTVRVEGGTSDTVRLYLREIGQVDLLSTEDERRLAKLIE
jgi:RNA polymerase primary sigma factor